MSPLPLVRAEAAHGLAEDAGLADDADEVSPRIRDRQGPHPQV